MKIKMIASTNEFNVIGLNNKLLWHCPEDLKFFKRTTLNNAILMGRKTKESLPIYPLPKRKNIVLTRNPMASDEVSSFDDAVLMAQGYDTLWIIGGQTLYEQFIDKCDEVYLTTIFNNLLGDSHFPMCLLMDLFPKTELLEEYGDIFMLRYYK